MIQLYELFPSFFREHSTAAEFCIRIIKNRQLQNSIKTGSFAITWSIKNGERKRIMDEIVRNARENINYTYYSDISMTDRAFTPMTFPEHWHMSAEFIMAVKDGCIFRIYDEEYRLNTGDVLLVWPAQLHQTVSAPMEGHIILQFSSELLNSSNDFNFRYRSLTGLHLLSAGSGQAGEYISRKMKECLELYLQQAPFSETRMRIRIYEILLYLCETQLTRAESAGSAAGKNHETYIRIQNACNYIKKNCREVISQKDAADVSGFSSYYFSRVFKEYTHESFSEYLTRQRIQNALALLYNEDIPITDVAYLSGFQSISNFSKVFRNSMGCSPLQYRKKHLEPG